MAPVKRKSKRQDKITVMLIPTSQGKPFQFQTSKLILKWGALTGVTSFVLLIALCSYLGYGAITNLLTEKSVLEKENHSLATAIKAKDDAKLREAEAIEENPVFDGLGWMAWGQRNKNI